jgi:hypothetical protein
MLCVSRRAFLRPRALMGGRSEPEEMPLALLHEFSFIEPAETTDRADRGWIGTGLAASWAGICRIRPYHKGIMGEVEGEKVRIGVPGGSIGGHFRNR